MPIIYQTQLHAEADRFLFALGNGLDPDIPEDALVNAEALVVSASECVVFNSEFEFHSPIVQIEIWDKEPPDRLVAIHRGDTHGYGEFMVSQRTCAFTFLGGWASEPVLEVPFLGRCAVDARRRRLVGPDDSGTPDVESFGNEKRRDLERWDIRLWLHENE